MPTIATSRFTSALIVALCFSFAGCAQQEPCKTAQAAKPKPKPEPKPTKAPDAMDEYPVTALISPNNDAVMVGRVGAAELADGVQLRIEIDLAPPGLHPVYVVPGDACSDFDVVAKSQNQVDSPTPENPSGSKAGETSQQAEEATSAAAAEAPETAPIGRIGASDPGGEGRAEFFLEDRILEEGSSGSVLGHLVVIAKAESAEVSRQYVPEAERTAKVSPLGTADITSGADSSGPSLVERLPADRVLACAVLSGASEADGSRETSDDASEASGSDADSSDGSKPGDSGDSEQPE